MMRGSTLAVALALICLVLTKVKGNSVSSLGYEDHGNFRVYEKPMSGHRAAKICGDDDDGRTWRQPCVTSSHNELINTKFDELQIRRFWCLSPDRKCYIVTSVHEGKIEQVEDCHSKMEKDHFTAVCMLVESDEQPDCRIERNAILQMKEGLDAGVNSKEVKNMNDLLNEGFDTNSDSDSDDSRRRRKRAAAHRNKAERKQRTRPMTRGGGRTLQRNRPITRGGGRNHGSRGMANGQTRAFRSRTEAGRLNQAVAGARMNTKQITAKATRTGSVQKATLARGQATNVQQSQRHQSSANRQVFSAAAADAEDETVAPGMEKRCMGTWKKLGGQCLYPGGETLSWPQAKRACGAFSYKNSKASLVNLGNTSVSTDVRSWLESRKGTTISSFWTSGHTLNYKSELQWTDTLEDNENTNNLPAWNSNGKKCVAAFLTTEFDDWLQFASCEERRPYVCQMIAPLVHEDNMV